MTTPPSTQSNVVIGENRLEMTRFFAYPREAVFAAWTESDQLQQWWGCRETHRVDAEIDLRTGGRFSYTMHMNHCGPIEYAGTYEEVSPPERLVTKTVMGEGTEHAFESTTTIEFTEVPGGTQLKLVQVGLPPMPEPGKIISGGFNDAFEKLDRHLAS